MARMNEADICKQCKQKGYFRTPELNEQLYLHFGGYGKIENLDAFTACRILWLEHNSIERIENLEALLALRVLHLEHNALNDFGTCILPLLETLNVAFNFVSDLSGLANFPNLQRFYAAHNDIDDAQLRHLALVPNLAALDLSKNKLSDPEALLEVLLKLPNLTSLQLSGNDAVRNVKNYRKRLICALPQLCHLDDTPIFENERRAAEAWGRGGREAEKAEYAKIRAEEQTRRDEQRNFFNRFVTSAKARGPTAGVETAYARTMRLALEEEEAAEEAKKRNMAAQAVRDSAANEAAAASAVTRRNENGGNSNLGTRAVAVLSEDDDEDIAIPGVSVATKSSPKKSAVGEATVAEAASPAAVAVYADPFANIAQDGEGPSAPDATEEEVLTAMKLDEQTVAGIAAAVGSGVVSAQARHADDASSTEDASEVSTAPSSTAVPGAHFVPTAAPPLSGISADPAPANASPTRADAAAVAQEARSETSPAPSATDDEDVLSSEMATPRPAPVE
jgi:dynein assembly factor 1